MLRNYLAAALRNVARNRLYAAINIVGLAVGFAAAMLALLFVRDELGFDRLDSGQRAHLPRVGDRGAAGSRQAHLRPRAGADGGVARDRLSRNRGGNTPQPPGAARPAPPAVEGPETLYWADPDFLDVIPLPVIAGDPHQALQAPDGLVMTRRLARKYFGSANPLGTAHRSAGRSAARTDARACGAGGPAGQQSFRFRAARFVARTILDARDARREPAGCQRLHGARSHLLPRGRRRHGRPCARGHAGVPQAAQGGATRRSMRAWSHSTCTRWRTSISLRASSS